MVNGAKSAEIVDPRGSEAGASSLSGLRRTGRRRPVQGTSKSSRFGQESNRPMMPPRWSWLLGLGLVALGDDAPGTRTPPTRPRGRSTSIATSGRSSSASCLGCPRPEEAEGGGLALHLKAPAPWPAATLARSSSRASRLESRLLRYVAGLDDDHSDAPRGVRRAADRPSRSASSGPGSSRVAAPGPPIPPRPLRRSPTTGPSGRPHSAPSCPPIHVLTWPRNPIDRFVMARLDREGLKPSPEADRTAT